MWIAWLGESGRGGVVVWWVVVKELRKNMGEVGCSIGISYVWGEMELVGDLGIFYFH